MRDRGNRHFRPAVASTWPRAFGAAEIEGGRGAVSPSVLASSGRRLIRAGGSVPLIDVELAGGVRLLDAALWNLAGPAGGPWAGRVPLAGPSSGSYARSLERRAI